MFVRRAHRACAWAAILVVVGALCGDAGELSSAVFVAKGKGEAVTIVGKPWRSGDGYLECSGTSNYLYAKQGLGSGDVRVTMRIALVGVKSSAASFQFDRNHFGFDGSSHRGMFVSGPLFGKTRFIGPYAEHIEDGRPFALEVVRQGTRLSFRIDGELVHECMDRRSRFGSIALRPWRATMRVYEFSAAGHFEKAIIPKGRRMSTPKPFDVPVVDLSQEPERRVIIAQGTPKSYKGHPTTLLLPDNKTMFCVYPLGHGRPGAVLRRSDDAGLTWSEPLDTPTNWKDSTNCPALYRLVGPKGTARLFVFEGRERMRQAVSEDEGKTWSPMRENGLQTTMPFTAVIRLKDGRHMGGWNWKKRTWISVSDDGGFTWGPARCIAEGNENFPGAWPAEPGFVRAPDGGQIACLLRENSRQYNSLVTFTEDEGKTWSELAELPRELTGDRHQPRYAPTAGWLFLSGIPPAAAPRPGISAPGWGGTRTSQDGSPASTASSFCTATRVGTAAIRAWKCCRTARSWRRRT